MASIARITRFLTVGAGALAVLATPMPAFAQDNNDEARLRKLEAEVRALQRRVFPGSDGRYFEPEITGVVIQKIAKCVVSRPFLYLGAIAISFVLITMQQLDAPPMEH